jgi:hypothetical protein
MNMANILSSGTPNNMSNNIQIFHLITGETIIAKSEIDIASQLINISNPIKISLGLDQSGNHAVQFTHFIPYAARNMILNNNVVAIADPSPEILEQYEQSISPIIRPQSNIIV